QQPFGGGGYTCRAGTPPAPSACTQVHLASGSSHVTPHHSDGPEPGLLAIRRSQLADVRKTIESLYRQTVSGEVHRLAELAFEYRQQLCTGAVHVVHATGDVDGRQLRLRKRPSTDEGLLCIRSHLIPVGTLQRIAVLPERIPRVEVRPDDVAVSVDDVGEPQLHVVHVAAVEVQLVLDLLIRQGRSGGGVVDEFTSVRDERCHCGANGHCLLLPSTSTRGGI